MNIFEFMSDSPILTFFIIIGFGIVIEAVMKQRNINKHGHPQCKCDNEEG